MEEIRVETTGGGTGGETEYRLVVVVEERASRLIRVETSVLFVYANITRLLTIIIYQSLTSLLKKVYDILALGVRQKKSRHLILLCPEMQVNSNVDK